MTILLHLKRTRVRNACSPYWWNVMFSSSTLQWDSRIWCERASSLVSSNSILILLHLYVYYKSRSHVSFQFFLLGLIFGLAEGYLPLLACPILMFLTNFILPGQVSQMIQDYIICTVFILLMYISLFFNAVIYINWWSAFVSSWIVTILPMHS